MLPCKKDCRLDWIIDLEMCIHISEYNVIYGDRGRGVRYRHVMKEAEVVVMWLLMRLKMPGCQGKNSRQLLEDRKVKEMDSTLEPPKEMQPHSQLDLRHLTFRTEIR
jgi:hypothetical protein